MKMEMEITVDTLLVINDSKKLFKMAEKYFKIAYEQSGRSKQKALSSHFAVLLNANSFPPASEYFNMEIFSHAFTYFFKCLEGKRYYRNVTNDFREEFKSEFPDEISLARIGRTKNLVNFLASVLESDIEKRKNKSKEDKELIETIFNGGKIEQFKDEVLIELNFNQDFDKALNKYANSCLESIRNNCPEMKFSRLLYTQSFMLKFSILWTKNTSF